MCISYWYSYRYYKDITKILQGYHKDITKISQRYHKDKDKDKDKDKVILATIPLGNQGIYI